MTCSQCRELEGRRAAERLLVFQLLNDDHAERWTREELRDALEDIEPTVVDAALEGLTAAGVAVRDGEHMEASPCARKFDALHLVMI
jgi:hypothetical protein